MRKFFVLAGVCVLVCVSVSAWAYGVGIDDQDSDRNPDAPKISLDGEAAGPNEPDMDVQSPTSDYYDDMGPSGSDAAPGKAASTSPPPKPQRKVTDEFGEPIKRW